MRHAPDTPGIRRQVLSISRLRRGSVIFALLPGGGLLNRMCPQASAVEGVTQVCDLLADPSKYVKRGIVVKGQSRLDDTGPR
jgi:hypothetical protein